MEDIKMQDVANQKRHWRIPNLEKARFSGYISKLLCTYRFYAKLIDISSSKNKTK
jgi:hypothetical protein